VKSLLLRQLADAAGGASYFAFIPDGTMNATVFNCALANVAVTCAADCTLTITLPAGAAGAADDAAAGAAAPALTLVGGYGCVATPEAGGGVRVVATPGALQYGEPRTFLLEGLPAGGWDRLAVTLSYRPPGLPRASRATTTLPPAARAPASAAALAAAQHRLAGADAISRAARLARMDGDAARAIIRAAAAPMLAAPAGQEPPILGDLLGEVSSALASPEAFNRWGEHFLRFLPAAALQQRRLNFKDPGGLAFGGAPFLTQLAALDEAFTRVGVPMPSLLPPAMGTPAVGGGGQHARGGAAPAGAAAGIPVFTATVFRDNFNNQHGGCFALHCAVALPGGRASTVGQLRPGDVVETSTDGTTPPAAIRCIVDYISPVRVVTLPGGGPTLTPWHPVRRAGAARWEFPARIVDGTDAPSKLVPCVRTFVLAPGSAGAMVIDGTLACTLAHERTEDDVIAHAFYGTQRVVDDLARFDGWAAGHVRMTADDEVWAEGKLVGYRPAEAAAATAPAQLSFGALPASAAAH
jgi:hypothetical protein